jgi:predicted transcriptional regulator
MMTPALPDIQIPEMDFRRAIEDILASGLTPAQVARVLNVPRSTLDGWRAGSDPRWHYGTAILLLHAHRKATPGFRNPE